MPTLAWRRVTLTWRRQNGVLTGHQPFHNSVPHIVPRPAPQSGIHQESYPSWVCVTSVRTWAPSAGKPAAG